MPKRQSTETLDTKVETLRGEMILAGAKLQQALSAESEIGYLGRGTTSRWKKRRRSVELAADEYATAVERWRTALERAVNRHVTHRQKVDGHAIRETLKSREVT